MTENEFWDTTPRAFFNKVEGYNSQRREYFELIRLQTYVLTNIQLDRKNRLHNPQQLWRYDWEKKKRKIDPDKARKQAIRFADKLERIEKRHGKNK